MSVIMSTKEYKQYKIPDYSKQVVQLISDRNKWVLATISLIIFSIISFTYFTSQLRQAQRNAQTLIVKLSPDSTHTVSILHQQDMPSYYLNTLNALIRQYIQRRYSHISTTIVADYGFAYYFMSPTLRHQFIDEEKAVATAQTHQHCKQCDQITLQVNAIQHYEEDETIINAKADREYRTTVFATEIKRNSQGQKLNSTEKIITLLWRIKRISEMDKTIDALTADPIGLEIRRVNIRNNIHTHKENTQ